MELNKTYIIRVVINERLLTYYGKIISNEDNFITFIDKFNKKISINKNNVQSYEEVGK
jgi:hypothetical protein